MMKPFVDSGFLLTLLLKTNGSSSAWQIARRLNTPLLLSTFQIFIIENRLRLEIEGDKMNEAEKATSANALQNLGWYLEQQVFQSIRLDYEIGIELAYRWQKDNGVMLSAMLLLWPALAATVGATHFLSFDPRTRSLAESAGMKLLPEKL